MKKLWKVLCLTVMMCLALPLISFAGQWQQDTNGWWYQNTNGSYLSNGWYWIGDSCYYFNDQGYVLTNTTTPDGQAVNESGAWMVNGVVQTRPTELWLSSIGVRIPNGYSGGYDEEGDISIETTNPLGLHEYGAVYVATVVEQNINLLTAYYGEAGLIELSDAISDELVRELGYNAILMGKNSLDFASGRWYHYAYTVVDSGIAVNLHMYVSYVGAEARIVMVMGENREFTPDQFVMEYIK
ncbi:MAG: hypothetical protein HFG51_10775 [Lachnospiraceae bacterium]|nr:hypothetical protein [Lachnospiraceae bacterium]